MSALARLVLGVLVMVTTGACGSAVRYEEFSPAVVGRSVEEERAPAVPEPPPHEHYEAAAPEDPAPPEEPLPPATPRPQPKTTAPVPKTTTPPPPPKPAPRVRARKCDWHANLERAKEGRPIEWIIQDTGAWGRAEVPGTRIWIAPRTPCDKVYSVAVHEWTHHMQGVVYRDWGVVMRELAPYGGPEIVADCGALLLGATWIKYGCTSQESTEAAAAILQGLRPPARDDG